MTQTIAKYDIRIVGMIAHEIIFTNIGLKTIQIRTLKDDRYTLLHMLEKKITERLRLHGA